MKTLRIEAYIDIEDDYLEEIRILKDQLEHFICSEYPETQCVYHTKLEEIQEV